MADAQREVLFVCTGNTCRSPMAEALFRAMEGTQDFSTSSAGVSASPGMRANPDTLRILDQRNITLENFSSRLVDQELLENSEAVFCMTESHLAILESMFPEYTKKYHLVCDFAEINGRVGADVPDPIGMGLAAYEDVANILDTALAGVRDYLKTAKK